jgi:hypothetical protein
MYLHEWNESFLINYDPLFGNILPWNFSSKSLLSKARNQGTKGKLASKCSRAKKYIGNVCQKRLLATVNYQPFTSNSLQAKVY